MKIRVHGNLLKIRYRPFNSGGKGGQHANKTLNAIEATTSLPDGRIVKATSQTSKSQHVNKRLAQQCLASRVLEAMKPARERRRQGDRVRTYHAVRNDVVDHASGEHRSYKDVIDGDAFGELVEARREAMIMREVAA